MSAGPDGGGVTPDFLDELKRLIEQSDNAADDQGVDELLAGLGGSGGTRAAVLLALLDRLSADGKLGGKIEHMLKPVPIWSELATGGDKWARQAMNHQFAVTFANSANVDSLLGLFRMLYTIVMVLLSAMEITEEDLNRFLETADVREHVGETMATMFASGAGRVDSMNRRALGAILAKRDEARGGGASDATTQDTASAATSDTADTSGGPADPSGG